MKMPAEFTNREIGFLKRTILFVLLIFICSIQTLAIKKYASPNGLNGNSGLSPEQAWNLTFALSDLSSLTAGDSLILLDGTYKGNFEINKSGTADKPIFILPANEGKAFLDVAKNRTNGVGLTLKGNHIWVIGLQITSSAVIRRSEESNGFASVLSESGIAVYGDNVKLINCWVYDVVGGGLDLWRSGLSLEVYGSVIFNNGSQDLTRGTGHGMYIQHDRPDQPKVIENNFVFQNASQGINIFTTTPENSGIIVRNNVSFNTGAIATFNAMLFRPPHNLTIGSQSNVSFEMDVKSNLFYTDLQGGRLSPSGISNVSLGRAYFPNRNITFTDNIIYGGRYQVELQPVQRLNLERNRFYNIHGDFFGILADYSSFENVTWDANSFFNLPNFPKPFNGLTFDEWKLTTGFDSKSNLELSVSSTIESVVTQNKYDPSRFHVSILSFSDSETIALDFSQFGTFKDQEYSIRDIQNPFDSNQISSGVFNGSSIPFPMNWTNSLQPKGNMPFQVTHTDRSFGTFLLQFKKSENEDVIFPEVKDSVAIFVNEAGKAFLTPKDFLMQEPTELFTYTSSVGFEFSCLDLGSKPIKITIKSTRTEEEKIAETKLWIVDTIPPYFDAANAVKVLDPVIGKVTLSPADFFISDLKDNCSPFLGFSLSRTEVSCSDIYQNGTQPVWEFPVEISAIDQSGNTFTLKRKVIIGNVIESMKVSISSIGPLPDGGVTQLVLGDELNYNVLYWERDGFAITHTGKALTITENGLYRARLLLSSGCEVFSEYLNFGQIPFVTYNKEVTLNLNEAGKAELKLEDVLISYPQESLAKMSLSQTSFSCDDLGPNSVKLLLVNPYEDQGISYNSTSEDWIKVIVRDNLVPEFESRSIQKDFDLSIGELKLNPWEFIVGEPKDNCTSDGFEVSLSQDLITCADVDSERLDYYIDIQVIVKDASGNSKTHSEYVLLKYVESKKVSIKASQPLAEGGTTTLSLGDELNYEVVEWRKFYQIPGQTGKTLVVSEPGTYIAVLRLVNGCVVGSESIKIDYATVPYPPVKESIDLGLDNSGKATLKPEDVFTSWPPADPTLDIKLSQSEFACSDLGENEIMILIKDQKGEIWEEKTSVRVKDQLAPVILVKNFNLPFDVKKGSVELKPENFISDLKDNCGIKEVTISKNTATCDDLDKTFTITIQAVDNSGNLTEATAILTVQRVENQPVTITGNSQICAGEKTILTLNSDTSFEVIRWRRNGVEVPGQTGKTLEVTEPGKYHAVIRYEGACLSESLDFEVKVNPLPSGKIEVEGNILRAPLGDFTYQWFRNGEKISGATSRTLVVDLMGEYTVELTSSAGCKAVLEAVTLTISGLFGKAINEAQNLKIYPNPASDRVVMEFPDGALVSSPSLSLYSSDGKNVTDAVQMSILNDSKLEIILNRLANGTYLIWVIGQDQKTYFGKLVILN